MSSWLARSDNTCGEILRPGLWFGAGRVGRVAVSELGLETDETDGGFRAVVSVGMDWWIECWCSRGLGQPYLVGWKRP